jgi:predicted aspartyl protease
VPSRSYPFTSLRPGQRPRPLLPVTIENPATGKKIWTLALIDTGADECALPISLAGRLGHTLERGAAKTVATAGGEITAHSHTAKITVEGLVALEATVDFIPGLGTPLLGVNSFLSSLILTVDYPRQTFTLAL